MAQTLEAVFYHGDDQKRIDHTPAGAAVAVGEIVLLSAGLVGVCTSPEGIADGVLGSLAADGFFKVKKAAGAGVTFTQGDKVAWDDTGNTAVPDADVNDDGTIGQAAADAADGDDHVKVWLNKAPLV